MMVIPTIMGMVTHGNTDQQRDQVNREPDCGRDMAFELEPLEIAPGFAERLQHVDFDISGDGIFDITAATRGGLALREIGFRGGVDILHGSITHG